MNLHESSGRCVTHLLVGFLFNHEIFMQVMADCRVLTKGKQIMVDSDPRLHGFWGADTVTTISHQSVAWVQRLQCHSRYENL